MYEIANKQTNKHQHQKTGRRGAGVEPIFLHHNQAALFIFLMLLLSLLAKRQVYADQGLFGPSSLTLVVHAFGPVPILRISEYKQQGHDATI